ncbi:hypothetical protein D021_3009A, partial [Vibrio parahaemolyticus 10296]
MHKTRN